MLSEIALWALQAPNLEALDFECSVSEIDYLIPVVVVNSPELCLLHHFQGLILHRFPYFMAYFLVICR